MTGAGSLSDQFRTAVQRSGMSRYAICKATGTDQAVMSRFMAGKAGLSLDTVDRVAHVLNLRITTGTPPRRKA